LIFEKVTEIHQLSLKYYPIAIRLDVISKRRSCMCQEFLAIRCRLHERITANIFGAEQYLIGLKSLPSPADIPSCHIDLLLFPQELVSRSEENAKSSNNNAPYIKRSGPRTHRQDQYREVNCRSRFLNWFVRPVDT
jgi:hypothetical protein